MLRIENGNKLVKIMQNGGQGGRFLCFYCQNLGELNQFEEQVLQDKDFATEKRAIAWAKKVLEIA